jgi:RNA polymerase sigma-70 factor (ECF subfamily)
VGADRVARFLLGIWPKMPPEMQAHLALLNASPGVFGTVAGEPIGAFALDVAHGQVQTLYLVVNPAKLHGLTEHPTA